MADMYYRDRVLIDSHKHFRKICNWLYYNDPDLPYNSAGSALFKNGIKMYHGPYFLEPSVIEWFELTKINVVLIPSDVRENFWLLFDSPDDALLFKLTFGLCQP